MPARVCTKTPGHERIDLDRAEPPLLRDCLEPDMRSGQGSRGLRQDSASLRAFSEHLRREHGRRLAALRLQRAPFAQGPGELAPAARSRTSTRSLYRERSIPKCSVQIELIEDGGKVVRKTRLYDS